jgi:hypothetical protein
MKKSKSTALIAAFFLLIVSMTIHSAFGITIPTFTLSAQTYQLKYTLPAGTTFNGSISTSGTIRFWASDPDGALIVNLGLVDNATTFSFVTQQAGNYTLNFENNLPNPVQVNFAYQTNPDLSSNNSKPLIYLTIPTAIAISGSVLIIVLVRRKRKEHNENSII